jgi:general stress protein YciG
MATQDRGFASMNRDRQREIARKGGKAAHVKGTAHEWNQMEAREAGRKGGLALRATKHMNPSTPVPPPTESAPTEGSGR